MGKRKRRIHGSLQRELWKIFYKIRPNDLLEQYQKYIKVICHLFKIPSVPEVRWCDASSGRQGLCIKAKGGIDPCGGGCYIVLKDQNYKQLDKGIIYLRDHYIGQDLLQHELFHHINELNCKIQEDIMWKAIEYETHSHRTCFRKTVKEALKK